jgi:hypothetical protein
VLIDGPKPIARLAKRDSARRENTERIAAALAAALRR